MATVLSWSLISRFHGHVRIHQQWRCCAPQQALFFLTGLEEVVTNKSKDSLSEQEDIFTGFYISRHHLDGAERQSYGRRFTPGSWQLRRCLNKTAAVEKEWTENVSVYVWGLSWCFRSSRAQNLNRFRNMLEIQTLSLHKLKWEFLSCSNSNHLCAELRWQHEHST